MPAAMLVVLLFLSLATVVAPFCPAIFGRQIRMYMTDGFASPTLSLNAHFGCSGSSITPENQYTPNQYTQLPARTPWTNHVAGGRHLDGHAAVWQRGVEEHPAGGSPCGGHICVPHSDREESVWIAVESGTGPRVGTAGIRQWALSPRDRSSLPTTVLNCAMPLQSAYHSNYLENVVTPSNLPVPMEKPARPVVEPGFQLSRSSSRP